MVKSRFYLVFGFIYCLLYLVLFIASCICIFWVYHLFCRHLGSGNGSLGKVRGHVALKVEVSQLLALLELKKRLQLGIRVDATAVLLVLQVVVADVGVDLAGDLSPGHLSAIGLSKELRQLLRNEGGLDKAGGGAVANLAALLGTGLLSSANLLDGVALKDAKLGTKSGGKSNHLLQLGGNGSKLRSNCGVSGGGGRLSGRRITGSGSGGSNGGCCSGLGLLGSLGLLGGLGNLGGRGSRSRGSGSGRRSGGSRSGRRSGSLSRLSHGCWSIPSIEMSF